MTAEEKIIYKRLQRQVQESRNNCFYWNHGVGTLKPNAKINYANNKLQAMKDFLTGITTGDYSNNRFMKLHPILTP